MRTFIFNRDRWRCVYCKRHFRVLLRTERLEVHHIDGNARNDDPANLQTVCSTCHKRLRKRGV